jgi:hypothetical protein
MNFLERFVSFFLPLGLGLYLLISTYFGSDLSLLPGDLGDTRFNLFILEHCHQYLTGTVNDFWNATFMYPEPEVISLSDNLLGTAPIYSVYRLLGFNLFSAFQYWAITLAILNYTSAYFLASHLSKKSWFAGIAAFIFAFSIGLAAQMNHAQTFPRFAIPLTLLFLLLWRERCHLKWFFWAVLALTYTFYCGIYLGFMTLIPFATLFTFIVFEKWALIKKQLSDLKTALFYGATLILNLSLLYVLFAPYLRRSKSNTLHTYEQVKHSIPTIESYLSAHPGTLIHRPLENLIGGDQFAYWDHWLFPGWLALIGLLAMFFLSIKKSVIENLSFSNRNTWLLLITGCITFLLFLRVGGYSLYYFLQLLPGFGAMRSMTRIINIELLFFGIGLAFLLTILAKKSRNYRVFVFLIAMIILLFDNTIDPDYANTTRKKEMLDRHNTLVSKMKEIPPGSVVSYEPNLDSLSTHIIHYQIDAMLAAQSLGLKSVNGYSAQAAFGFHKYWMKPNPET